MKMIYYQNCALLWLNITYMCFHFSFITNTNAHINVLTKSSTLINNDLSLIYSVVCSQFIFNSEDEYAHITGNYDRK